MPIISALGLLSISATGRGLSAPAVCRVWGQCCVPALWRPHLRGLQGILQEDSAEERQVRLPGGQELPGGQAEKKPLPVLPFTEVPGRGDGAGGGEDGQPKGKEGEASNKTKEQPGGSSCTSSFATAPSTTRNQV